MQILNYNSLYNTLWIVPFYNKYLFHDKFSKCLCSLLKTLVVSASMTEARNFSLKELSLRISGLNMELRILYLDPFFVCLLSCCMILGKPLPFSKLVIHHFKMNTKTRFVYRSVSKSQSGRKRLKTLKNSALKWISRENFHNFIWCVLNIYFNGYLTGKSILISVSKRCRVHMKR